MKRGSFECLSTVPAWCRLSAYFRSPNLNDRDLVAWCGKKWSVVYICIFNSGSALQTLSRELLFKYRKLLPVFIYKTQVHFERKSILKCVFLVKRKFNSVNSRPPPPHDKALGELVFVSGENSWCK